MKGFAELTEDAISKQPHCSDRERETAVFYTRTWGAGGAVLAVPQLAGSGRNSRRRGP